MLRYFVCKFSSHSSHYKKSESRRRPIYNFTIFVSSDRNTHCLGDCPPDQFVLTLQTSKAQNMENRLQKLRIWKTDSKSSEYGKQTPKAQNMENRLQKLRIWKTDSKSSEYGKQTPKAQNMENRLQKLRIWKTDSKSSEYGKQTPKAQNMENRLQKLRIWKTEGK